MQLEPDRLLPAASVREKAQTLAAQLSRLLQLLRKASSTSGSTGFVRCRSNPDSRDRRMSISRPHPVTAARVIFSPQGVERIFRAAS